MISLQLWERAALSTTAYIDDLTRHLPDWRRSIRAKGGYWMADATISRATMTTRRMQDFFNSNLGRRIVEIAAGRTTWEGEIVEMDLTIGGVTYRKTLSSEQWHNKVMVNYGFDSTAWSEETNSSDIYGESGYVDVVSSGFDSTIAAARRDRRLTEYAYPKARVIGGLGSQGFRDTRAQLRLTVAGYVFTMNRRYQESDIAAAALSAQISTLVGNSEFVTAGSIETNATSEPVLVSGIPARLWDLIDELIDMGDTSGNKWVGGVYEDREFDYKEAEAAITHYWRGGRLLNLSGQRVLSPLIKPDIIVQISDAPTRVAMAGGDSVLDDSRNVYVDEVEFIAPDGFRLLLAGRDIL